MLWGERRGHGTIDAVQRLAMELPMPQQPRRFEASRSLTALEQDGTIIAGIEISQSKWLVAALVPGVGRQPLKKFDAHEETPLKLLHRWRHESSLSKNRSGRGDVAVPSNNEMGL
jgi:transposase